MFAAMIPPTMGHAQQQMLGMFTKGIAERIPRITPPINAGFILSFMFVYTFTQSRQALGERGERQSASPAFLVFALTYPARRSRPEAEEAAGRSRRHPCRRSVRQSRRRAARRRRRRRLSPAQQRLPGSRRRTATKRLPAPSARLSSPRRPEEL